MNAGRELDALVAEKVMGLAPVEWSGDCLVHGNQETGGIVPAYSTNIPAAWKVVEKLHGEHTFGLDWLGFEGEEWRCVFNWGKDEDRGFAHAVAATAPLAICLAALQAAGVEVPA